MSLIAWIFNLFKSTYVAFKEASAETKLAVGFATSKCHYITPFGSWEMSGIYSKDRQFFKPRGIERIWRAKNIYPFNGVGTIIYCYNMNPDSIKFGDLPKKLSPDVITALKSRRKELEKDLIDLEDKSKRENALDTISFADYDIAGADILESFCEDILDNTDMRFVQGVSRGKVLLLIVIGILIGLILGGIISGVVVLAIVSG